MPRGRKRRRHTPEERARAVALLDEGQTLRFVADSYGITPKTLASWRDKLGAPQDVSARAKAIAPDLAEDDAPVEDAPADDATSLELLRRLVRDTQARLRRAELAGNHTVVQRMGRDLAQLANTVARLERLERQDDEAILVTRDQLIEARTQVLARVQALASRPLHCASCARKLSVEWGREGRARTEGEKTDDQAE